MKKITVLIVEDSGIYRNLLRESINGERDMEVVSVASNGKLALPRIRHYKPDFILLDQEMPMMTGLEALEFIRQDAPDSKVIMFSSHTTEGAQITLQALEAGALDFVTKPDSVGGDIEEYIQTKLIHRIRQFAHRTRVSPLRRAAVKKKPVFTTPTREPVAAPEIPAPTMRIPSRPGNFRICAVGISTGGPVALREFLALMPPKLAGAILVVQHMPPVFTAQLARSLDMICPLSVREAENGSLIEDGHVYIAPGGHHMKVSRTGSRIIVDDTPPRNNCRPSVNVLFESLAEAGRGSETLALIMTGMGDDGLEGLRLLSKAGSRILAQSADSCVVYGMPAGPVQEGLTQKSLNIAELAQATIDDLGVNP